MPISTRAVTPQSFSARLRRLRGELSNTRLTLLVALLFTMLVASIFPTPSIRFMVALLCAAPFAGIVAARFFGRSVRASRSLPETAIAGEIVNGRIEIWNSASHPVFFVRAQAGSTRADETPAIEAIDSDVFIPLLKAGERRAMKAQWRAHRRGVWDLAPLRVGAGDPLGITAFLKPRTIEHELVVLPRPIPLMRLGFLAGAAAGAPSHSHAAAVAQAIDFHGIHAWRPGEGVRRVHWKSTARTGQLHVIDWEEDLSGDVSILLDVQAPPGAPSGDRDEALETAVTIAASVAAHVLESGQRFELFCWINGSGGTQILHHRARGANGLAGALRALAEAQIIAGDAASLAKLAQACAHGCAPGSSVLLLAATNTDLNGADGFLKAAGIVARRCTALLIEKETAPDKARSGGEAKPDANSGVLSPVRNPVEMRTRTVRRGDSLVALLEQDL